MYTPNLIPVGFMVALKARSIFVCFFWIIPWRLNFICQLFGKHCLFRLHSWAGMKNNWGLECWGIYMGKVWLRLFSSRINTPTFSTPVILHTYPPMKKEETECSETLAYKS
jgi:hypothetical protein